MALSLAFVLIIAVATTSVPIIDSFRRFFERRIKLVWARANNSRIINKSWHLAVLINFLNCASEHLRTIYDRR